MERPLDQIFLVKSGQKGTDFGFGHFSTVKSRKFSTFPKINFFWSEWLANWFLGSLRLKFMDKMLKSAKKAIFWVFCQFWSILTVFENVKIYLVYPSRKAVSPLNSESRHPKVSLGGQNYFPNLVNYLWKNHFYFRQFFDWLNLVRFVPEKFR